MRTPRPSPLIAALVAAPLVLAGCASVDRPPTDRGPSPAPFQAVPASSTLEPFGSCDDLLDYYQSHALDRVGAWGLGDYGYHLASADGTDDAAADSAGAETATSSATEDYSTTNNQEAGVDEADIVKTDGTIIVTATYESVTIVDLVSGETAEIPLPDSATGGSELLLQGDTLVVLTREYPGGRAPADTSGTYPAFGAERTVVTTVDISDPSAPHMLGAVRMEGGYRSARLIDGTVRLVMVSEPSGVLATSPSSSSLVAEAEAEQRNRELIEQTTIEDWVPHVQIIDADGTTGSATALLDCADISHPQQFSGFSTLSVLSFDLGDAGTIAPDSTAGVIGDGSTAYASPEALIVATSPWEFWTWAAVEDSDSDSSHPQATTDLHLFDISDPAATTYQASGRVGGRLLNQFALSETDGVIRAATTLDATGEEDSQSSLIMLAAHEGELVETGRLDGLGIDERIYAVRYLSPDLASVVTFREVDPLYLIDTADPTNPELLGELKIPGYSAYLHPIDDQYLLGVGQDADESNGWTTGLQVSLFDISDLNTPERVSQVGWEGGYSTAEWDHRAFTYWPATGQVYLPLEVYTWDEGDATEEYYAGVVSVDVDTAAAEVTESDRTAAAEKDWAPAPQRTIVIGDDLWVLRDSELVRYDLDTLEQQEVIRLR